MLSPCFNLKKSWSSTFLNEAIYRSPARFLSFSDCSRTKRPARPTLSVLDGAVDLSAPTAKRLANPIATPLGPVSFVAGSVDVKPASPLARSWNAHTAVGVVLGIFFI
jgi:hypothetical protein